MANKTQKLDLKNLKPASVTEFAPLFEVTNVEGRSKMGGDFIHAELEPRGSGADTVGKLTIRMPAILSPGSALASFAALCGQDPAKGFDLLKCNGTRIRLTLTKA